jgi:hypothetical protein
VGGVLAVLSAFRVFRDRDGGCEEDLMRTGTTWVNRMRERLDADFHLRVTSQATGAGGAQRTLVREPWADQRRQAPQTNYRYLTLFGIRFQFGSIFNSAVNLRFGNIGGVDDF